MSHTNTRENATTSNTVRFTTDNTAYAAQAARRTTRNTSETTTSVRGIRRPNHRAPMTSAPNAAPALLAKASCSTVSPSIGTRPTPMRPTPMATTRALIVTSPPRRTPNRGSTSDRVSAADITAIPAPESTTAALKHTAARSSEVPRVLKLCDHHLPVGVRLMLAMLPAARSIAMRLKVR